MYEFRKTERLCSKKLVDKLFGGGNSSVAVYPLRAVFMTTEKTSVPVSILISVPKRRFHHAVDRNRMKRQVREAYRKNKHILWDALEGTSDGVAIAFVCIADKPCRSTNVNNSVVKILHKIRERLEKNQSKDEACPGQ